MKKTKLLLVTLLVLLCGCLLCSCILEDEPAGKDHQSNVSDEVVKAESFGDEPYHIYYTPNGDGTCYVSDVTVNPSKTEDFTLVIPETSPQGDTVTAIYTEVGSASAKFDNLPILLTEAAFERMLEPVENKNEHAYNRFRSYFVRFALEDAKSEQSKQNMIEQLPLVKVAILYRLDPTASAEDMKFLSDYLTEKADYTAKHKNFDEHEILALADQYVQPEDKYAALRLVYNRNVSHLTAIELPSTMQAMTPDPNSWGSMDINPFTLCDQLSNISVAAGNTKYHSVDNCLILTEAKTLVMGCKTSKIPTDGSVTAIGMNAYKNCIGLAEILIPDCVIKIQDFAFSSCTALEKIVLPENLEAIGAGAFQHCAALTEIVIPDTVKSFGYDIFVGCQNLSITVGTAITDPEILQKISSGCHGLNLIYTGKTIVKEQFRDCGELASVAFSSGVTELPTFAFAQCTSLTRVTLPNSITTIGARVFTGCDQLSDITYGGTMAEWAKIQKDAKWNTGVPATVVHCTDGDVSINE